MMDVEVITVVGCLFLFLMMSDAKQHFWKFTWLVVASALFLTPTKNMTGSRSIVQIACADNIQNYDLDSHV